MNPEIGWSRVEKGFDRSYFHEMLPLDNPRTGKPTLYVCAADNTPGFWPASRGTHGWRQGVVGARAALYTSVDWGSTWTRIGTDGGLPEEMNSMIWSLCEDPTEKGAIFAATGQVGRGYATGEGGEGALLRSPDAGESWTTFPPFSTRSAFEHWVSN